MKKKLIFLSSVITGCLLPMAITSLFPNAIRANALDNQDAIENLEQFFTFNNASIVSPSVEIPSEMLTDATEGPKFKVNSSSSFIDYNEIIDLKKLTGDVINIIPNIDRTSFGLTRIKVTMTDVNDATNSVSVLFYANPDGPRLLNEGKDNEVKNNATLCSAFAQVSYMGDIGAYPNYAPEAKKVVAWRQCFLPTFTYATQDNFKPLSFKYNCDEKAIYMYMQEDTTNYLVLDLDNEDDDYPDFPGFSTNEVMLSIESDGSSGEFVLASIGNDKGSDLAGGGSSTGLRFGGYDFENMVNGVVNYPYPMPVSQNKNPVTAKLEKQDGSVWKDITNQLTKEQTEFVPTEVGHYRLSYTGKTTIGADASASGEFDVIASPIEIEDKSGVTTIKTNITEPCTIPTFLYEGGIGKLKTEYSLTRNGVSSVVNPNSTVVFDKKGTKASLEVKVTDSVTYSKTFAYPIEINENYQKIQLLDTYDIISVKKGETLIVPDFIANDYSKEPASQKDKVTISSSLLEGSLKAGDSITVNENGTITYSYASIQKVLQVNCLPSEVTAENIGEVYPNSNDVSSTETSDIGTEFVMKDVGGNIYTPNPVSTNFLNLSFAFYSRYGLDEKYGDPYTSLKMNFHSLGENKLTLELKNLTSLRPNLYINGTKAGNLTTYVDGYANTNNLRSKNRRFSLILDGVNQTICNGSGMKIKRFETWSNGLTFDGFQKGQTLVDFELVGGKKGDKFVLDTLGNQSFSRIALPYGDMASPQLSLMGELKSRYVNLNETVNIPMAYAYDVLASKSNIVMTVKKPDGKALLNRVAPQEYSFVCDKPGRYVVSYMMSDQNNNSSTKTYTFTVLDQEAPTLSVNGNYKDTYTGEVEVLEYSVSDNISEGLKSKVFLEYKDMHMVEVKPKDKLNLENGKYAIIYFVKDNDGNTAYQRFEFVVKK